MKNEKTKYFLVGCATLLVGIIVAFIILGVIIWVITLAYAQRGNAWAITTIIASLFVLIVIFTLPWWSNK